MPRNLERLRSFSDIEDKLLSRWRGGNGTGQRFLGEGISPEEQDGFMRAVRAGFVHGLPNGKIRVSGFATDKIWSLFRHCAGGIYWHRERFTQIAWAHDLVAIHGWNPAQVALGHKRLDVAGLIDGRVALAVETKVCDDECDAYPASLVAAAVRGAAPPAAWPVADSSATHWKTLVASGAYVLIVATIDRWYGFDVDGPRLQLVPWTPRRRFTATAVARRCPPTWT